MLIFILLLNLFATRVKGLWAGGCPGRGPVGILTPPPLLLSLQEDQLGLSLLTLQQLQSEETLRRVREIAHQV